MNTQNNGSKSEYSDSGFPIEIYTDERIREFLAEDELTPEQKRQLEKKLKKPQTKKSPGDNHEG